MTMKSLINKRIHKETLTQIGCILATRKPSATLLLIMMIKLISCTLLKGGRDAQKQSHLYFPALY